MTTTIAHLADRIGATRVLAIGCVALFCAVLALYAGVAHDHSTCTHRRSEPLVGIDGQ